MLLLVLAPAIQVLPQQEPIPETSPYYHCITTPVLVREARTVVFGPQKSQASKMKTNLSRQEASVHMAQTERTAGQIGQLLVR